MKNKLAPLDCTPAPAAQLMTERAEYWQEVAERAELEESLEPAMIADLATCLAHSQLPEAVELVRQLVAALPCVEEPSLGLDGLVQLAQLGTPIAVPAMFGLVLVIAEHRAEVPQFFELLHQLLTPELAETETDQLATLVDAVLRSENLSLRTTQRLLKRLAWLSLRVATWNSHRLLRVISAALLRHKRANVLYKDKSAAENTAGFDSFQPYLFEIDALKDHPVLADSARQIKSVIALSPLTDDELLRRVEQVYRHVK